MQRFSKFIWIWGVIAGCLMILPIPAWAIGSLGEVAGNILVIAVEVIKIAFKVSTVLGIGLLIGSVLQYLAHRRNPVQVRISRPILFFVLGWVCIALPYIAQLSESSLIVEAVEQQTEEEREARRKERERHIQEEQQARRRARESRMKLRESQPEADQALSRQNEVPMMSLPPEEDRGFYD